jgi:acetolactate synthase-1/2/3 large subunit
MGVPLPGGRLAAQAIAAAGVDVVFTLSGGHLLPIYEGCREEGVRVVDLRHEQSAAHAAEAWGRVKARLWGCARHRRPRRDRHGDGGR